MKLIITEKPSVAAEYKRILHVTSQKKTNGYFEGNGYIITWCIGHLITMSYPDKYDIKYKKWSIEDLPFLPNEYKYEVIESVKKQCSIVSKLLNSAKVDTIYYAGDSGREGLYIQWLVRSYCGHNKSAVEKCIWIDSQTEEAILKGIRTAKPMDDYRLLADAGYMRGIEDYAIGINFSRILTLKYADMMNSLLDSSQRVSINVGRVMTCVLGMVVQRERERRNFIKTKYYKPVSNLCIDNACFRFQWHANDTSILYKKDELYKDVGFLRKETADTFISILSQNKSAQITEIEEKKEQKSAPLLYNLADLQNECSSKLKLSPDQTLAAAQELYEAKLTTYPRTDARVLSTAVAKEIEKNIRGLSELPYASVYVNEILTKKLYENISKTKYVNDKKITDHYAIIPTGNIQALEKVISSITENSKIIYKMIVERFLSIFYPSAVFLSQKVTAGIGGEYFYYSVKRLLSPGYLEITGIPENSNEVLINAGKGDLLPINDLSIEESTTKPPAGYTTGSLIMAMEKAGQTLDDDELREQLKGSGIGTSATRSDIIKKLEKLKYIKIQKKTQAVSPDIAGEMVHDIVYMTIRPLLSVELTANWEKGLSLIAQGKISKETYQEKLYQFVIRQIEGCKKTTRDEQISAQLKKICNLYYSTNKIGKKHA